MEHETLSLEQLTVRLSELIEATPGLHNVWVTAETSDVRRGAHCYMELLQKNPKTGEAVARARATIWRSVFARIDSNFYAATGSRLDNGMKIRVLVNVNFHPAYGLSLNIIDIDPAYTMGDLMRLRMEILARLQSEGVIDMNRSLDWPETVTRIAVISAEGAAGYGDFMHQLYNNPRRLRFTSRLYPALMQGNGAPASIIAALDAIAEDEDSWDCVVIIRGGGATSDLAAFENYELATNIAQFPLPVIIGIGHERDVTVLDYVAKMRVKTPTAAAEWLIGRGESALKVLDEMASSIHRYASSLLSGCREQLAYISATLPFAPVKAVENSRKRLDRYLLALSESGQNRLAPEKSKLDLTTERLQASIRNLLEKQNSRIDSKAQLLDVLSPEATLRRGYSITRLNGKTLTSSSQATSSARIETILAHGTLHSTVD